MAIASVYRSFTQFHENERFIGFAQSLPGRGVLWILACVLVPFDKVFFVAPCLGLYLMFPRFRTSILSLGGLALLYSMLNAKAERAFFYGGYDPGAPWVNGALVASAAAFFVGVFYLFYRGVRRFDALPPFVKKRPQVCLHLVIWTVFVLSWVLAGGPLEPRSRPALFFWIILTFLPFIAWRIGYLLMAAKRGRAKQTRFQDHLFYLWPLYGGTNTPFGKGHDDLARVEPKSDAAAAKSHLAGIRLLILAKIWLGVRILLMSPGLTDVTFAMRHYPLGSVTVFDGWLALLLELVKDALYWAFFGHGVIGVLRLFGFYAFRNMYKPFLSQTILEFWNRYYYYYKELLVEFFFYPTYLSFFRNHPRLRLFAATMAAAFLGNLYFHVLRDVHILAPMGLAGAFERMAPRAMYSFLLAAGIYVSFLREKNRRGKTWATGTWLAKIHQARRIFVVLLYFTVIHVWIAGDIQLDFQTRTSYFFWLLGWG